VAAYPGIRLTGFLTFITLVLANHPWIVIIASANLLSTSAINGIGELIPAVWQEQKMVLQANVEQNLWWSYMIHWQVNSLKFEASVKRDCQYIPGFTAFIMTYL
jgi:hypothetical protein